MKCPRCKINELQKPDVMNALSRRGNKTYICSACGTAEAMVDFANSRMMEIPKEQVEMEKRIQEYIKK